MLLRSITKHVKDQNWFAVVLDFFIVVAGILIAFQVNNWNEANSDRANEREYLKRMSADLARIIEDNENQAGRNSQMISDIDVTLSVLDACAFTADNEAAFASGLFFMGRYNLPEFVSGTFDELNATGNFQLIRNLELRRSITDVYENIDQTYLIDKQFNSRITPKVNYVRKHVRFKHPADVSRDMGMIDPAALDLDFDTACRDREFKNSVSAVRETLLAINRLTRVTTTKSVDLKAAIDQELGISPKPAETK